MGTPLQELADEFSRWTQGDFVKRVELFRDQFEPGHPGHGSPREFTWTFTPRFRLCRLAGARKEWILWSVKERTAWIEDYAPRRHEHLEVYWLPQPWSEPLIVVQGTCGRFYAWDGNHRIGAAFAAGLKTLPTIAGLRKSACFANNVTMQKTAFGVDFRDSKRDSLRGDKFRSGIVSGMK